MRYQRVESNFKANSNYSKIKRKEKSRQPETIPVGDFWSLSEKLSDRFEKMKC